MFDKTTIYERNKFMKKSKITKIIEKTALQHGVSTEKVRADMQAALDHAYENNRNDPFWSKWRRKPTLEQFIMAATDEVLARFGR